MALKSKRDKSTEPIEFETGKKAHTSHSLWVIDTRQPSLNSCVRLNWNLVIHRQFIVDYLIRTFSRQFLLLELNCGPFDVNELFRCDVAACQSVYMHHISESSANTNSYQKHSSSKKQKQKQNTIKVENIYLCWATRKNSHFHTSNGNKNKIAHKRWPKSEKKNSNRRKNQIKLRAIVLVCEISNSCYFCC